MRQKKRNTTYTINVDLEHNESLIKRDNDTGELIEVKKRMNNIPDDSEVFEPNGVFTKIYDGVMVFLLETLSSYELKIVMEMVTMASMNTNSLAPLGKDTTIQALSEKFNIGRNQVTPLFNKLFKLGVYAGFEVYDITKPYTKFWVLNPYLAFAGRLIKSDIKALFNGTIIAKVYFESQGK